MRAYASGEIRFDKAIDFEPIIGEKFADINNGMIIYYDEYFYDDIEKFIEQIDGFCKANNAKADGNLEIDYCDGYKASYYWNNSAEHDAYEGEYWMAHQCSDNVLIWELKKRGYDIPYSLG